MDSIVGNKAVKMLSLNGIYPSAENDNKNIPVLIDWILSDEGQDILEKTGYVRINP